MQSSTEAVPKASLLLDISTNDTYNYTSQSQIQTPSDPNLPISHLFASSLQSNELKTQPLRADNELKPLYISEDGRIFIETFSPVFNMAQDFLIAISEPISRFI